MNLLFVGDIVGRAGREVVVKEVPRLRTSLGLDLVIANGENAAGGFGITGKICKELYEAGVDVITTGNHVWDQREALTYITSDERLLRPHNFPAGTPGKGVVVVAARNNAKVAVINVMGRVFMDPLDDPFASVEGELAKLRLGQDVSAIVVDIHAEATSEKMAMGHFADGRASLVVGTHSHVPTADAQILPGGTAYQTDAGACADYDSVIGMEKSEPLHRFTKKVSGGRFTPALGPATFCAVYVEIDRHTGVAERIEPVRLGGRLMPNLPKVRD